ncbi:MAG: hypothetical protein ABI742_10985, partial [Gemmatimonadota bacterium]
MMLTPWLPPDARVTACGWPPVQLGGNQAGATVTCPDAMVKLNWPLELGWVVTTCPLGLEVAVTLTSTNPVPGWTSMLPPIVPVPTPPPPVQS